MLTSAMPGVAAARQSGLIALVMAALGVLPVAGDPLGSLGCADAVTPQLAPSLTDLHHALGDVMGSPTECALVDADGNTVQATSTGVAVYRTTGMSLFVSGEHHWALSVRGLETWDGSWHNGMYPAVMSPPDQDQPQPAQPAPASVEAVTLVQVRQDVTNTIVVEDAHGSMLTVETVGGCPDMVAALGDHIFMRSGGTQTDLVLLKQHEICAVATVRTAEGN